MNYLPTCFQLSCCWFEKSLVVLLTLILPILLFLTCWDLQRLRGISPDIPNLTLLDILPLKWTIHCLNQKLKFILKKLGTSRKSKQRFVDFDFYSVKPKRMVQIKVFLLPSYNFIFKDICLIFWSTFYACDLNKFPGKICQSELVMALGWRGRAD